MHLLLSLLLWGCGSPTSPREIRMPPSVEFSAKAPRVDAPGNAPPEEAGPTDTTTAQPAPGTNTRWPPVEPPEGNRDRDWEWSFKNKGATKRSRERQAAERDELSAEDLEAIELGEKEPPEWLLALQDGEPKGD